MSDRNETPTLEILTQSVLRSEGGPAPPSRSGHRDEIAGAGSPADVVAAGNLTVVTYDTALIAAIDLARAAQPDVLEKILDGKVQASGAVIGAVMKAMAGTATRRACASWWWSGHDAHGGHDSATGVVAGACGWQSLPMSSLPKPARYTLAALIGAVAVPAAAIAVEFGGLMLIIGIMVAGMAAFGQSPHLVGLEMFVVPEVIVAVAGIVCLAGAIEVTRPLAGRPPRRRFYRRAILVGAGAAACMFPVLGFASYVTLHGRTEPDLPVGLIVTAIVLHMGAGLVAWPVGVLRPELRAGAEHAQIGSVDMGRG